MKIILISHKPDIDGVYITDLSVGREVCDVIDRNPLLKSKIRIFDHHKTHLFVNDYDFGTAININETGTMESGSSLFYKYLLLRHLNAGLDLV